MVSPLNRADNQLTTNDDAYVDMTEMRIYKPESIDTNGNNTSLNGPSK